LFDHNYYIQQFLADYSKGTRRYAANYGVSLAEANVSEGEQYFRLLGVHHLLPEENQGKHNLFICVLNEQNEIMRFIHIKWRWEGHNKDELVYLDKPLNEPSGNISVWGGMRVWAEVQSLVNQSDRVVGIHTTHPDEHGPQGQVWNSLGHHSFFAVWRLTTKGTEPLKPGPDPDPDPDPNPPGELTAEEVLVRIEELIDQYYEQMFNATLRKEMESLEKDV
jgi:hypothetical protein